MQRTIRAGIAGLLVLGLVPAAASATTVRAEGFGATILPETAVAATGPVVTKDGRDCAGNTAAAALDRAVGGDWDGTDFGAEFGVSVDRIRNLNLPFPSPTYWNFDLGNVSQPSGACTTAVTADSEVLFYEACAGASSTACFTGQPLRINAPAVVTAGQNFAISVVQYDDTKDPAPSTPAGNALVAGGGQSATTTSGTGTASFTFEQPGTVTLVATKGRQVRDAAVITVQAPPVYEVPTPTPTATATPEPDTTAPVSKVTAPKDGAVFKRKRGPRTLRASVVEEGALDTVRFGLFRKVGKRCTAFDAVRERFVKARCGARPRFDAGTDRRVSYLLPNRLGKGKYVFDVVATDAAGNRETVERGRNKAVFRVR